MRTHQKIALLATLYLSQGLPFGFFSQALPTLMRERGLSVESIGIANLLALPWALKFLWAPLMDRYGSIRHGRRRGYIVPLQLGAAAVLLLLSVAPAGEVITALAAGVLLTNLLAATQDIATDGLAIDLLSESERGLGNGVQVAGYRVGMILGGGAILVLFDQVGWQDAFLAMAATLLVATLPIARFREPSAASAAPAEKALGLLALRSFARRDGVWSWLILLSLWKAGEAAAAAMVRPFFVDRGLSLTQIGWLVGGVGFASGLLGAVLGGHFTSLLGRRTALVVFGVFQSIAVLTYAWAALGGAGPVLVAACALEHLASGTATAALFTAMMDACRPHLAATDYTVQASTVVIASGAFGTVSGYGVSHLGYAGHFGAAGLLSLAAVGFLFWRWPSLERFWRQRSRPVG